MLPIDFQTRMKEMLGAEYDDFMASYDKPRFYALRINTLKGSVKDFTDRFRYDFVKVPWADTGSIILMILNPENTLITKPVSIIFKNPVQCLLQVIFQSIPEILY